jgi:predicted small lipoprotein YifL
MRPAIIAMLLVTACGPISLPDAERLCFDRARQAEAPRGEVGIGASNRGGAYARGEITITSDYLRGADPETVYNTCVVRKTGQNPARSYSSFPDRRG